VGLRATIGVRRDRDDSNGEGLAMKSRAMLLMLLAFHGALAMAADTAPAAPDPVALAKALSGPPLPAASDALAEAKRALASLAPGERGGARWLFVQAMVHRVERDWRAMRAVLEKIVAADPSRPEYQFWYGNSIFNGIDDLGMLSKLSAARRGRDAYAEAVRLDPAYVDARVALASYYSEAPGIAGGSTAKAGEQASALLALPGDRGAFQGRMLLARLAAKDKDWAEMSRQYQAAETAGGEGASPSSALASHAWSLVRLKGDPAAALPVLDRFDRVAKPDDTTPAFVRGEAYRALGRHREAVEAYAKVLAARPDAANTRWGMAESLEALDDRKAAAAQYDEFATRFPKDDRAAKARERAGKLK
jgi:tetratricopeptide (TPR) repeat protein